VLEYTNSRRSSCCIYYCIPTNFTVISSST